MYFVSKNYIFAVCWTILNWILGISVSNPLLCSNLFFGGVIVWCDQTAKNRYVSGSTGKCSGMHLRASFQEWGRDLAEQSVSGSCRVICFSYMFFCCSTEVSLESSAEIDPCIYSKPRLDTRCYLEGEHRTDTLILRFLTILLWCTSSCEAWLYHKSESTSTNQNAASLHFLFVQAYPFLVWSVCILAGPWIVGR